MSNILRIFSNQFYKEDKEECVQQGKIYALRRFPVRLLVTTFL